DGEGDSVDVDTASFEEEAESGERSAAAAPHRSELPGPAATHEVVPREPTERFAAQPDAPPRPGAWSEAGTVTEPQDARWIGEAFEGSTPLSPADLGTLASIGVEPGDGVGALRLLAALVRILNRGQVIEPDDLRTEIRESRAAGAAAAAVGEPANGAESEASPTSSAESSSGA